MDCPLNESRSSTRTQGGLIIRAYKNEKQSAIWKEVQWMLVILLAVYFVRMQTENFRNEINKIESTLEVSSISCKK